MIIDGIKDRWDIDEYFKDIEDVWGYVAFENNAKIDSGRFWKTNIRNSQIVLHIVFKRIKPQKLPLKTWGLFVANQSRWH